jgi:hypothetical protein
MSTETADHLGPFKAVGYEGNLKIGHCEACGNIVLRIKSSTILRFLHVSPERKVIIKTDRTMRTTNRTNHHLR